MTSDRNDERLLGVLSLIENDLETMALSILAVVPPLIHLSLPWELEAQADILSGILQGLGEAHRKGAEEIRARLKEALTHD